MLIGPGVVLFLVIGAIVAAVIGASRRSSTTHPAAMAPPTAPAATPGPAPTPPSAAASAAAAQPPAAGEPGARRPRRVPAAAEALGYLGGVLAIVGIVMLVARGWDALHTAGRLGVSAFGAIALTAAGLLVRGAETEPAVERLRAFLLLLASAAVGVVAGVVVVDVIGSRYPATVAVAAASSIAVHSGWLWRWRDRRPLQQVVAIGGLLVAITAALLESDNHGATGLVLLGAAAVVVAAGVIHLTPLPALTELVGAVATLASGGFLSDQWRGPGLLVMLTAALALVALSVVERPLQTQPERLVTGLVGVVGMLMSLPPALGWFSRHAGIATGLVTALAGASVMALSERITVRLRWVITAAGGLAVIGGVALTGAQSVAFATTTGLLVSVALVGLGMTPGRVLHSLVGSLGLMVNVPWSIGWFFPGEGRVPVLILVSGAVIVGIAVLLTRLGGRFRDELRDRSPHRRPPNRHAF